MTLDQLITLQAIDKCGSFKAASEFLHKTQPSLSMAIKKLEEEFEITIFNRDGYRPELTEHGKRFLEQTEHVIDEVNKLEQLAREMGAGLESEIHICADAIFPVCHIGDVLEKFFDPHISTRLNLNTDVLEGVIEKVKNHDVDFALGPKLGDDPELECTPILEADIIPVIAKKHLDNPSFDKNYIKELPQVVVKSSSSQSQGNIHGAFSHQFWYTTDFSMKEQLIKSGLGWGRLPSHQITHELENDELVEITGIDELKGRRVPMCLIRSNTKVFGPNTKNLWNFLIEKFK